MPVITAARRVGATCAAFCAALMWSLAMVSAQGLAAADASKARGPQRVASLNVCTDQLLIMLAEPERIVSVSHMARDPKMSTVHARAQRLPVNFGRAEEIVALAPDLVLVGAFTAPSTVAILVRLGLNVARFAPAYAFADIRANLRRMGALLGRNDQAEALIATFDDRLDQIRASAPTPDRAPLAAYYYANTITSGRGTLEHEVMRAAGWRNLAAELGLAGTPSLPLEILVFAGPDLIVRDRTYNAPAGAHAVFDHPAFAFLERHGAPALHGDNTSVCGTPHTLRAVERLVAARARLVDGPNGRRSPARPRAQQPQ